MNAWSCPQTKICPFLGEGVCGHEKEKPIFLSYHSETLATAECYVGHIINCWDEWLKLHKRWSPSVKRVLESVIGTVLDEKTFQQVIGSIILHHDVGKLTEEYQNKKFFRHEAISAYILYHWLEELCQKNTLAAMFGAAVYLHHEGLQIAHKHFEMREPTYSYLINWLSPWEFRMINGWNKLIAQINQKYLDLPISSDFKQKSITGSDVAETLGSIMITIDGCTEPPVMRMAIAAILHPLTICDNRAANKRGGMPSTISRALSKFFDEGALARSEE